MTPPPPDPEDRSDDGIRDVPRMPDPSESWWTDADQEPGSLVDLVNRVLDRGVVVAGHVTISVAGVDLVYLGLNAVLTSVAKGRSLPRHFESGGDSAGSGAPPPVRSADQRDAAGQDGE